MDVRILSGSTQQKTAEVDKNGHLHVQSVSIPVQTWQSAFKGNTYNVNSVQTNGTALTLTNATETPVLYFQNGEEDPALIDTIVFMSGPTTGGTTNPQWRTYKKSSAITGDIVTNARACVFQNNNFGSSRTMSLSTAYRGAVGDSKGDGTLHVASIIPANSRNPVSLSGLILPQGSSIEITCQAGTSNTSMNVMVALSITHLKDMDIA